MVRFLPQAKEIFTLRKRYRGYRRYVKYLLDDLFDNVNSNDETYVKVSNVLILDKFVFFAKNKKNGSIVPFRFRFPFKHFSRLSRIFNRIYCNKIIEF